MTRLTQKGSSEFLRQLSLYATAAYVLQRTILGLLYAAAAAAILYPFWSTI